MKKILTKLLLISLLFSAVMPAKVQASFFSWATLSKSAATIGSNTINWLTANCGNIFNFLKKHPVAAGVAALGISFALYKLRASRLQQRVAVLPSMRLRFRNIDLPTNDFNSELNGYRFYYLHTNLTFAITNCLPPIVKRLLDREAKSDINNTIGGVVQRGRRCDARAGWTPLMLAAIRAQHAENNNDETKKQDANQIIQHLLDAGADPNIQDGHGKTVCDYFHNKTISKFMQSQITPVLNDQQFSPLPPELAKLTPEFTY